MNSLISVFKKKKFSVKNDVTFAMLNDNFTLLTYQQSSTSSGVCGEAKGQCAAAPLL